MNETNQPFFILGAPRSGTTLLRDIMKSHDRLTSPEETFYFRWPYPFGSTEYVNTCHNNPTLRAHRKLDGMNEETFRQALSRASSRKDIMDFHGGFVAEKQGKPRWFDKTPQNVYGAIMIAGYYPDSKFICIRRHPLNVAASLIEGRQLKVPGIEGAIGYWVESAIIMLEFQKLYPDRLINVQYEDLTCSPEATVQTILTRLNERSEGLTFSWDTIHAEQNRYERVLTTDQIDQVLQGTAELRSLTGY
ncbi:MAG: sulfotransferase [Proteobacteria bacterium]|nr:sulfotransferase [Pseudomonadota bacterium]